MAKRHLRVLFASSFFFSAHLAIIAYINSTALARFVNEQTVGLLYAASSILSLVWLFAAPAFLRRFGNWKVSLATLLASFVSLLLLAQTRYPGIVVATFIFYFSLNTFTLYTLDIFVEHYSTDKNTGNIRGLFLTSINLAWVAAPFVAGLLIAKSGFNSVYLVAAALLIPATLLVAGRERHFKDEPYRPTPFFTSLRELRKNKDVRRITLLNFLLQLFYAWMVIYVPLYLAHTHGFSWQTMGIIFTFMLLPFVIFQYPAGKIADAVLGEKELLVAGFLIMALATLFFALIDGGSALWFGVTLFTTRVGASVVEVMCETYFFKKVTDKQVALISFYRDVRPLAYLVAPILGAGILLASSYQTLFMVLAGIMVIGTVVGMSLKDTK